MCHSDFQPTSSGPETPAARYPVCFSLPGCPGGRASFQGDSQAGCPRSARLTPLVSQHEPGRPPSPLSLPPSPAHSSMRWASGLCHLFCQSCRLEARVKDLSFLCQPGRWHQLYGCLVGALCGPERSLPAFFHHQWRQRYLGLRVGPVRPYPDRDQPSYYQDELDLELC